MPSRSGGLLTLGHQLKLVQGENFLVLPWLPRAIDENRGFHQTSANFGTASLAVMVLTTVVSAPSGSGHNIKSRLEIHWGTSCRLPPWGVMLLRIMVFILGGCHSHVIPSTCSVPDPFQTEGNFVGGCFLPFSTWLFTCCLVLLLFASAVRGVALFLLFEHGPVTE